MIVRCGRCQIELEVPGAGEFVCPACGTRNAVRGAPAAPASPFGVPDLGGVPTPPPQASDGEPGVRWIRCPTCAYRFAVGEVSEVGCPACSASLNVSGDEVSLAE